MNPIPAPISPPSRVLLGPGPSDVAPSVLRALGTPTIGHLDPRFLSIMDEISAMQRVLFGTENELCIPMSGTGSAGMETLLVNLLEPGSRALVGVNGVFGTRMAEVARRSGAEVTVAEGEWGRAFTPDDLRRTANGGKFDVVCLVHAETSTGVAQDMKDMRAVADECGALLLLDTVTSLGGMAVKLDAWGVDAAYSGTQKCLSCPPGLAPVTFSPRAIKRLQSRSHPVQSWYLDLNLISSYWGGERAYHHTAPINMLFGLHEALRLALAEGLEARFSRHHQNGRALWAGLAAMGLELPVPRDERLAQLTVVRIPQGVDDDRVRGFLLEEFSLEIGGGLGPLKGQAWRIGLMGAASTRTNVTLVLSALAAALAEQGAAPAHGALAAAAAVYGEEG
ncbi:MAG: alanine--glyoxylate aminotransferase family protein [bacterium]|nr:alanine--glyoxylate aminotransferase family protein [Planctomycetota bacterium]HIL52345.1 alanine--glyoxylate aminotransferase family protein [Planctomycetota bacterium]